MIKVCITGGSGYVGLTLAKTLTDKGGYECLLLDWEPPTTDVDQSQGNLLSNPRVNFTKVDIRDRRSLELAFQGASIVFHVASYGMSGSSQLNSKLVEDININGTKAVVAAALNAGVERLVVTSTYNVVFGGQSISRGDETLPYFPLEKHPDAYSRSKAIAEKYVLSKNGTPLHDDRDRNITTNSGEKYLLTCAVRPAAIWGPGERRHTPRIVRYLQQGLFLFVFGDSNAKMDFVHVQNLVDAHILAAERLKPCGTTELASSAGQAYFVSDGEKLAINNFEFFRPLVEGLGYPFPWIRLPLRVVYFVAFLTEVLHTVALRVGIHFEPLLTRAEVYKAGVNHYFSIDKARNELGYTPKQYDFQEVVDVYRKEGETSFSSLLKSKKKTITAPYLFLSIISVFIIAISMLHEYIFNTRS